MNGEKLVDMIWTVENFIEAVESEGLDYLLTQYADSEKWLEATFAVSQFHSLVLRASEALEALEKYLDEHEMKAEFT
jgi:hypothetical protein